MTLHTASFSSRIRSVAWLASVWLATLPFANAAHAADGTVNVTVRSSGASGGPISVGYRWLLEEDSTWNADPYAPDAATTQDTLALNFHKSHMTVVGQGHADASTAAIPVPDTLKRYFLSVLPDQSDSGADPLAGPSRDCAAAGNCWTQSGRQVTPELFGGGTTADLTITVASQPVPTAQIFARAFQDSAPINGVWDDGEAMLGGWTVFIYDMGGQMMTDTFGNPLGTVYDGDGNRVRLGDGTLHTMTDAEVGDPARNPYGLAVGEVLVKGLAPGKYGMQIVPPTGQEWQQVSTIEGTKGLDVWVKANEPRYFAEFGPAGHHAEFGFITTNPNLNDFPKPGTGDPDYSSGGNTVTGQILNLRMARPPEVNFSNGHPLLGCWVGLNNAAGTRGLMAAPCDENSNFSLSGLADGTYQLVVWDKYLDQIIDTRTITLPADNNLGPVGVFRWFGAHEHYVFMDDNDDGIRDPGERGIPDQAINLRYRDGSIYNSSTTDTDGYLPFDEIFPFFSWLVAEVDFARFKATGVTVTVDAGGPVVDNVWGRGAYDDGDAKLNPQTQSAEECTPGSENAAGFCQARTEKASTDPANFVGPPLLEGYNSFIGTTEVFEWGKKAWNPGENGGITGVVYYQTTRAENDPRFAAPETWEPGIPRVQVALYHADSLGRLYHNLAGNVRGALATSGSPIDLADVDNYPLDNFPGPEDVDRHPLDDAFNQGDAIEVAHSDSFDDLLPEGCRPHQNADGSPWAPEDSFYLGGKCYDALRNFSQVRPAVFDGGYAFGSPFTTTVINPGYYVVEASPPRGVTGRDSGGALVYGNVYEVQQEEDKNVDFGDAMAVSPQALPPYCVGGIATNGTLLDQGVAPHEAGDVLTMFSTSDGPVDIVPGFTGTRPGCDFRLVQVTDGKNAAADFFMFTAPAITGHIQGFVLNDAGNEFDQSSPNFGEKPAPSWIPVSVRDYEGSEVYHTYTDKWGTYNAIVPSAYRINTPMPSGVSPNMLQVCLNAPTMQDAAGNWVPEPRQNRQYTQFCYTLDFKPGQTTYLDTPVLPIAAFASMNNWQLDCEYPSGTPVIKYVNRTGTSPMVGPYVTGAGQHLSIFSMGNTEVPDPLAARVDSTIPGGANFNTVSRDFGFGGTQGQVWIGATEITGANIVSWNNDAIEINVPAAARTGQLRIRRSNGFETVHGLTVTIDPAVVVHSVQLGESIQAAIDAANAGDIVMVEPGTYLEMLVMTKPIQLQGMGAASTIIDPVQSPTEKIALWRDKLNYLANCSHEIGLLPGQTNNVASSGPCGFTPGSGLFTNEEGSGVLVAPAQGVFGGAAARIDGLTISGADQSAGVMVNAYATGLEISNNIITNNQGAFAAGIRVGQPMLFAVNPDTGVEAPVDAMNDGLRIHHNHVAQNGGLFEAGAGIGLYTGTDGYLVNRNYVCGNFAGGNGAGIAHYGFSPGGRILENQVLFNQAFDQTAGANTGNGGGIMVQGYALAAAGTTPGTGSVAIERNLIQGNNAGSGTGGGISTQLVADGNGAKVVSIVNNIIVNNVAGLAGGGIAMDNASRVSITNNTIVNNESTASVAAAFSSNAAIGCVAVSPNRSCPQPAGVYSEGGNIGAGGFRNNIVLGNRALHVEVTNTTDPSLPNFGVIASVADPGFADISGAGLYSGTDGGQPNGIRDSLLSNNNFLLGAGTPAYCTGAAPARNNTCVDPAVAEPTHFIRTYQNLAPSFGSDGNFVMDAGSLTSFLASPALAAAADEGGNFIDIHYGPLSRVVCDTSKGSCAGIGTVTPGTNEVLNDYHLLSGASGARDLSGAGAPAIDIDNQSRGGSVPSTSGNLIANSSFEAPVVSGESATNPTSWPSVTLLGTALGPDGTSTAMALVGTQSAWTSGNGTISQAIESVVPSATYSLSVNVGRRADPAAFAGYQISLHSVPTAANCTSTILLAAGQVAINSNSPAAVAGWNSRSTSYTAPGSATGFLCVVLRSTGAGGGLARTYFDSVTLTRTTTVANLADRGADEYLAASVNGGAYVPGATANNGLGNLPPEMSAIANQNALGGALFNVQALATDPNGDPLLFRLTTSPAGMTINAGTGIISWTPAWASSPAVGPPTGCTGTGNTRTCNVTVQASDNAFAGGSCLAANCAARNFAITLRRYDGSGPNASNDPNNAVTTMGTFTVAAPGVLANDSSSNGSFATLKAQLLSDNTTADGQLSLAADGSFTFIPNADWVGDTNFTYRAFDGVNYSAAATVTLSRQISAPTARYISGTWTFSGFGSVDGRRIHIVRDQNRAGSEEITTTATRPTVAGGAWSFTRTGGPDFQVGDTVTILSENLAGAANFSLLNVLVQAGAANDILSTAHVQCPIDANHDGLISVAEENAGKAMNPPIICKHLGAGDGWIVMGDDARTELYTFGFNDVSKVPANQAIGKGILNAHFPAPTLDFDEGDEIYLTLTNVGMLLRPDLFDPHSVHFHGFPNAAAVFDGVPEASITINMGFSYTYYYKTMDPGTYMYHCHVEAAEHMQMGMLGNLYVRPKQNRLAAGTLLGSYTHQAGDKYVYNDGDASTKYDVEFPIQIGSMDRNFHEQHIGVQPLPFAEMHDDYPMLNGRGYPDTMDAGNLPPAPSKADPELGIVSGSESSQQMNTRIVIVKGQKALLRISDLNVTRFYTLATTGLPMKVIGTGAHILRGPAGGAASNLYYTTNSVTLGGGESADVLIDTSDPSVLPGRYLLYSTNLEALSNGAEDFGGMMTEIVVTAP